MICGMADPDLGAGCTGIVAITLAMLVWGSILDFFKNAIGLQVIAFVVGAVLFGFGLILLLTAGKR